MSPKKMMSKNFSEDEMKCPCCGVLPKQELVNALQMLRDRIGRPMTINSAMRCAKHNAAVGGVPNSQHTQGIAADIAARNGLEKYQLVDEAIRAGFHGIGVAETFVHLDLRVAPGVLFTYGSNGRTGE